MLAPGQSISGKYRIVRLIGEGGMGSVYEAEHQVLGTRVALKFLHPEIAKQRGLKERFLQEARVSATVVSPHICRVSDVDTDQGSAYLVMEMLQGEPLQAVMDRELRLDVGRAVDFSIQVLEGLQVAHARGVVHRDLKPDNVFLLPTPSGPQIKLLDFGIAKLREDAEYKMTLTRPGAVMGTPEYMAPEQAYSADLVDQRSDLYSVGVILFEMLSGRRPADGENPQQIAEQILTGKAAKLAELRPDLPPLLVEVVQRAIQGNPLHRWSSAEDFIAALLPFSNRDPRSGAQQRGSHFNTSAATSFRAVSRTPVVGEYDPTEPTAEVGLRLSAAVPRTLPPEDGEEPPPSVMEASQPRIITADMPVAQGRAVVASATIGGTDQAPLFAVANGTSAQWVTAPRPTQPKLRSSRGLWWSLGLLVLMGAAGAGGWLYYAEVSANQDTPPLPSLRTHDSLASPEFEVPEVPEAARRPVPGSPAVRGTPRQNLPKAPPIDEPGPVFTMPTQLPTIPLPTGFPTALPTGFPFPVPPSPPPAQPSP
ncbi:MAG: hypothetical protein RJA70_2542 [Pseudomonadota bacterium]|jgi:serine/threonine protein kinase